MDANRFDSLLRALSPAPSRRHVLRGVLLGSLGFIGRTSAEEAMAHDPRLKCKKLKGDTKKKCLKKVKKHNARHAKEAPPTGTSTMPPPPPFCADKADFTPCGAGQQCSGGVCARPPTCLTTSDLTVTCNLPSDCCGNFCEFGNCGSSSLGQGCKSDLDCAIGNCVGFVCSKGSAGDDCDINEDCTSNSCVASRCQ